MLIAPTPLPTPAPTALHVVLDSGSSHAAMWTGIGSAAVGVCAVIAAIITSRRAANSVTQAKHLEYKHAALLAFLNSTFELTRLEHRELWARVNKSGDSERIQRHAAAARDARVEFRRAQVGARVWGGDEIAELGDAIYEICHEAMKGLFAHRPGSPARLAVVEAFDVKIQSAQNTLVDHVQVSLGVKDAFG